MSTDSELNGTITAETFLEPSEATLDVEGMGSGAVSVRLHSGEQRSRVRLLLTDEEADRLGQQLIDAATDNE